MADRNSSEPSFLDLRRLCRRILAMARQFFKGRPARKKPFSVEFANHFLREDN